MREYSALSAFFIDKYFIPLQKDRRNNTSIYEDGALSKRITKKYEAVCLK